MSNPRRPPDANQLAKVIVDLSTGDESEPELNPKLKAGQLGGLKGGKARAEKLTPEEQSAIAKKPAEKSWNQPNKYLNTIYWLRSCRMSRILGLALSAPLT